MHACHTNANENCHLLNYFDLRAVPNLLDFVFLRPQREMLGWIVTLFISKQLKVNNNQTKAP